MESPNKIQISDQWVALVSYLIKLYQIKDKNNLLISSYQIPLDSYFFHLISIWDNTLLTIPFKPYITPYKSLKNRFIILISGNKNIGKSTLSKFLLHSLLHKYNKVSYIETDLGQPTYTPSGIVSLHEFDNHEDIDKEYFKYTKACYLGTSNPESCPIEYLKAVWKCQYYAEEIVVVNTHGWIKGLGKQLLKSIHSILSPNVVVQLGDEIIFENKNVCAVQGYKFSNLKNGMLAQDKRNLKFVNYFLDEFNNNFLDWNITSLKLASKKPFEIKFESISLYFTTPVSYITCLAALNNRVVGLARTENSAEISSPNYPSMFISEMDYNLCGLALLRGIDIENKLFYILTNCSLEELNLNNANLFIVGNNELKIPSTNVLLGPQTYVVDNNVSLNEKFRKILPRKRTAV